MSDLFETLTVQCRECAEFSAGPVAHQWMVQHSNETGHRGFDVNAEDELDTAGLNIDVDDYTIFDVPGMEGTQAIVPGEATPELKESIAQYLRRERGGKMNGC